MIRLSVDERFELTTALKSDVPLTAELKRRVEKLIKGEESGTHMVIE